MSRSPSPWLVCQKSNPGAKVRLYCFPYAGRGASAFRGWGNALPDWVEVWAIQLPGRENRFHEAAHRRIDAMIDLLADLFRSSVQLPYAFFGHSMGALIAFELARRLEQLGPRAPSCLFVSGYRAADLASRFSPFGPLSDQAFLDRLAALGGISKEVLENNELVSLLLPSLRADIEACETYRCNPNPKLACPMVVYGGLTDESVCHDELLGWKSLTVGEFAMHEFPGGHFFLHSAQALVFDRIILDLQKYAGMSIT